VSAPLPPEDLASRRPRLVRLRKGAVLHRFYPAEYEPIFFDSSQLGRFNSPDGSYGVLYTAREAYGAFAETFLRQPGRTLIDAGLLRRKAYARVEIATDLNLIRLAGPSLAILGATAEVVHSGLPYDAPQAWSRALFEHPLRPEGIAYYARHDDEGLCYAIFDRARGSIREIDRETDLDQDWFWRIAQRYKVGLAPS